MEPWQRCFREGLAPLLSMDHLKLLRKGLEEDDPRIIIGATTSPPWMNATDLWPIEGADAVTYPFIIALGGFSGEQGGYPIQDGCTIGEASETFARLCYEWDQLLGEPVGCRHWLNWYDDGPREEVLPAALAEVRLEIKRRLCVQAGMDPGIPDEILHDVLIDLGIE